ncbi:hypothetical protein [Elioraea rosea]|uniref:hypothetical protein n=1 Tax=Elioraea rosea TaxID=2492390 RepID=UPI001183C72D|nr:hypothetical protein [Elioraea rosea]
MASSSGYVLFSQTSRPFGTRELWGPDGLPGTLAGSVPGLVNGVITDFPVSAFDAFQGTEFVRGDWALFDFVPGGQTAPDAPLTGAIDASAVTSDGRVFAGPAGPRNPDGAFDTDPAGGVSIVLADRDWNGIKNVEVVLTNAELGGSGSVPDVFIRNIVDVRVKLGDSLATQGGPPPSATLVIENAKRGEIDASELGQLWATVSLASNEEGWGNTFVIKANWSSITLLPGDWAGGPTALDGFGSLVNDGSLTHVVVTMSGDALFDARAVNATTDVRAGPDAGFLYENWQHVGYQLDAAASALFVRFDAPAAMVDLGLRFAVTGPLPPIGAVTLWRDGVAIETVADAFSTLRPERDPVTGERFATLSIGWLATRSFDTLTVEGLGALGAPIAQSGTGYRPGWTTYTTGIPDAFGGVEHHGTGSLLVAGGGRDVFRYAPGDNVDSIWLFAKGQDVLALETPDARIFDSDAGTTVMFGGQDAEPWGWVPIIDERSGITLVGVRDLAVGTDIVFV